MKEGCEHCERPVSRDEAYMTVVLTFRNEETCKRVYCTRDECMEAAFAIVRLETADWD